jgi:hypothetical protein
VIRVAVFMAAAASADIRSAEKRSAGPEIEIAAIGTFW